MPSPSALAGSGISTSGDTSQPSLGVIPMAGSSVPSGTAAGTAHDGLTAASALCNLLPRSGGSLAPGGPAGVVFGKGLPPVPLKLAEKIRRWEFFEMAKFLPEHWGQVPGGKPDDEQGGQRPPSCHNRKVTDIVSWSQCFAFYVRILAGTSPGLVPDLLVYMVHMLQVSQDFGGLAWTNYDQAFRRQAASTGNRLWSMINPSLYSIHMRFRGGVGQQAL